MVGTAVALFSIVAVAEAANVYTVTLAQVLDPANKTKAGTKLNPKPARIKFGYTVDNTDPSQRPSVTTRYDINFGKNIRQNRALFTAKNGAKFCTGSQAGYSSGLAPACPAGANAGSGIVKNKAGLEGTTGVAAFCNLKLTLFVGDGKSVTNSDGNKVRNDIVLALKGGQGQQVGGTDCSISVDAALPAEFVRKPDGSTSLAFPVPKNLQNPQAGVENAVYDTSSNVFKTVRVKTRVRRVVRGKVVFVNVFKTRGLFETVGCTANAHKVLVTYTDKSGAVNTASKNAPCTK